MLNIAVLGSTKGTDLQAVIDAIEAKKLAAKISFVLSNKKDAYILERARKHNLKAIFLDPKNKTREEYDKEVDKLLQNHNVELVLLIGYMKLMSSWFVQKWLNKVMNIHPSLLPAFAGGMDKNVHKAVLERGCKITGCSLIFIDEGADTGPIILQRVVNVEDNGTADTLKEKVQKAEQEILLQGIKLFAQGKLKVKGKRVMIGDEK
jgi:phosphoribosylglycinamide formyltransferase-1